MTTFTPGTAPPPPDPLALDQPKTLGQLLSSAWRLWRGQPGLFVVTAALVVIPIHVFVVGAFGHGFSDPEGQASQEWDSIASILIGTLGVALVTATHARSVVALAERRELTTETAFKLGLAALGTVMLAGLLYLATVMLGVLALIVGAFAALVYGIFTTQIVALEGVGAGEGLQRSWQLVRENGFWRTFGYQFVLTIFAQIGAAVINVGVVIISLAIGEPSAFGIVAVIANAIALTVVISWTALVNTLLYFSWKAESRLRASGQLPFRDGVPIDGGQGVSFVKPASYVNPNPNAAPPSPTTPAGGPEQVSRAGSEAGAAPHPGAGPGTAPAGTRHAPDGTPPESPADPPDFPYDDIPPRRPQP